MCWLLLSWILGCSPTLRYPGPLDSLSEYRGGAAVPSDPPPEDPISEVEPPVIPDPLPDPSGRPAQSNDTAHGVVQGSIALLGQTRMVVGGETYRHDCIGMVEAAYAHVGIDLTSDISLLYAQAETLGVFHREPFPLPGDVVFFDNTYDKNRNGVRDDPNTHVAVVESVEEDGTIHMVHLGGRGKPVTRRQMNLLHPSAARSPDGKSWNSHLRSVRHQDGGPGLSGQLWTGFGSFWTVTEQDLAEATRTIRSAP